MITTSDATYLPNKSLKIQSTIKPMWGIADNNVFLYLCRFMRALKGTGNMETKTHYKKRLLFFAILYSTVLLSHFVAIFEPIDFFSFKQVFQIIGCGFIAYNLPLKIQKSIDAFALFYLVIVFFANVLYSSFNANFYFYGASHIVLLNLFLIVPFLVISWLSKIQINVKIPSPFLKEKTTIRVLIISTLSFLIFGFWYIVNSDVDVGFDIHTIYTRRLQSRLLFPHSQIQSYLNGLFINGIMMFLLVLGFVRKRYVLVGLSFLLAMYSYWGFGVKSLSVYFVLFFLIHLFYQSKNIVKIILIGFLGIYVLAILEPCTTGTNFSYEYIIRRIFLKGNRIQIQYVDYFLCQIENFSQNLADLIPVFYGVNTEGMNSVSLLMGDKYDIEGADLNSNTVLVKLLRTGILGYVIMMVVLGVFYNILNQVRHKINKKITMLLSIFFSIFLLEQEYTIVLVSSGFGICFLLSLLIKFEK